MKIAIASDHRGFRAKESLKTHLTRLGHEIIDFGCDGPASCDYPDMGIAGALSVARGEAQFGVLFCGTGIGMSMASNKVPGIRAALCHDELSAEMARRHNNANVLCLPADLLNDETIHRLVEVWLTTDYEGGRHDRRLKKLTDFETNGRTAPPG